ncbi:hypothetical protein DINM_004969 [Dirofilaria immitis]|nr:hypothetical protein [Dirofilaria immitis]
MSLPLRSYVFVIEQSSHNFIIFRCNFSALKPLQNCCHCLGSALKPLVCGFKRIDTQSNSLEFSSNILISVYRILPNVPMSFLALKTKGLERFSRGLEINKRFLRDYLVAVEASIWLRLRFLNEREIRLLIFIDIIRICCINQLKE